MVQLTPRDLHAIEWIGQAGVAGLDQLARRHWQGQQRPAQARLVRLSQAGYLQAHHCNGRGFPEQVYSLRRGGGRLIAEQEPVIGLPRNNLLAQQLRLQEIYLWLAACLQAVGGALTAWHTEYALQYQLRHGRRATKGHRQEGEIPDGRVLYTIAGQLECLDIEIDGRYYGQHLHGKVTTYGRQSTPVLWVCPAQRVPLIIPLIRAYTNIILAILEDTPNARPYCPPAELARIAGRLPWIDHGTEP